MAGQWTFQLPAWAEAGLSLLYPEVCQLCGEHRAKPAQGYVCDECRRKVCFITPPFCRICGLPFEGEISGPFECGKCHDLDLQFQWARSSVRAHGPALEAIHRYKYNRQMWFENFLAELLLRGAQPELRPEEWDAIMPVPLHPLKEREREFNQAERLARHLSEATGIPLVTRVLRRTKATGTQALLSRTERQENVRGAFSVRSIGSIKGWRCLLVDDVFTTGCTTSACAWALRQAGAEMVAVWTVARGG